MNRSETVQACRCHAEHISRCHGLDVRHQLLIQMTLELCGMIEEMPPQDPRVGKRTWLCYPAKHFSHAPNERGEVVAVLPPGTRGIAGDVLVIVTDASGCLLRPAGEWEVVEMEGGK